MDFNLSSPAPWGVGGYSNIKVVYVCHAGFKNGGLREQPLTENGGLSELPHMGKKGIWS